MSDPASHVQVLLDYIWAPIALAIVTLWRKLMGYETRVQLLEQAEEFHALQRVEEKVLRDAQRKEMMDRIDEHHKVTMAKLEDVEKRVKNGH